MKRAASLFNPVVSPLAEPLASPLETPTSNASQVVNGTEGNDWFALYRSTTTNVDTFGGNDIVELYGTADYNVETGSGNDRVYINGTGVVTADGGEGLDRFYVNTFNTHHIDGGAGTDFMDFSGLDRGVRIDVAAGTAQEIDEYNDDTPLMTFENIEYVYGSDFKDSIRGTGNGDHLYGNGGGDYLYSYAGNDLVSGGDGDDSIYLYEGNDIGYGGDDDDNLWGMDGNDRLYGQDGDDLLGGGYGDDVVLGGNGNDMLDGHAGNDVINGGAGADRVLGGSFSDSANDVYNGGTNISGMPLSSGNEHHADTLDYFYAVGSANIDADLGQVSGDAAGVPIVSQSGPFTETIRFIDTISNFERFIGTKFGDTFRGSSDPEVDEWFYGDEGDDLFRASHGDDNFDGGNASRYGDREAGFDTVDYSGFGGSISLNLEAGEGQVRDFASGSEWTHTYDDIDQVIGTDYGDILGGNDADNRFEGGRGTDILTGEGGADTFVYDDSVGNFGYDRIIDFETGEDLLEVAGLSRTDGTEITDFAGLDTNGDGMVTADDTTMVSWQGNSILVFSEGVIELQNVTMMGVDDFVFA